MPQHLHTLFAAHCWRCGAAVLSACAPSALLVVVGWALPLALRLTVPLPTTDDLLRCVSFVAFAAVAHAIRVLMSRGARPRRAGLASRRPHHIADASRAARRRDRAATRRVLAAHVEERSPWSSLVHTLTSAQSSALLLAHALALIIAAGHLLAATMEEPLLLRPARADKCVRR